MLVRVHYEFHQDGLLYGARNLVEDKSSKSSEDIAKQFCNENNFKLLDFEELKLYRVKLKFKDGTEKFESALGFCDDKFSSYIPSFNDYETAVKYGEDALERLHVIGFTPINIYN